MYLLFPEKNIVVANNLNLDLYHVKDVINTGRKHQFNKWQKTDNPDGSFYLSFIDYRKQRYWLQNSGDIDVVAVKITIGESLIEKDNTFVYKGKYGVPSGFTLNISEGYLSDINITAIKDLSFAHVCLVDDIIL
jgi:hypothetical protein